MTAKCRVGWVAVASVLWLLAAGASAQGPMRPQPERSASDGGPQRMMSGEQRPEQLSPRDGSTPGGSRLSPEERRQLRRDVHEAGREIYPGRMSPGRRESRRQ